MEAEATEPDAPAAAEPATPPAAGGGHEPADRRSPGLISVAVRGLVTVAILAAGALTAWALIATAPAIDLAPVEAVATPVQVFEPVPQPVARRFSGFGTAEALGAADVPARVTATVAALGPGVRAGARVEAGQTLATLEDEDFRDEVTRLTALIADANARLAELDVREARLDEQGGFLEEDLRLQTEELTRVENLNRRSVATGQDLDRARSQVLTARTALSSMSQQRESLPAEREALTASRAATEAQLAVAERNLGRSVIRSPIAGFLQDLDVEAGEAVSPGQRVARVVDPERIEVPLRLPAGARRAVGVGDRVSLRSSRTTREAPASDPVWSAEVVRINPTDNARTRTLTVYAVLEQAAVPEPERLAPGLFVAGTVTVGDPVPRTVVPRRSLRRGRVQLAVPGERGPVIQSAPVTVDFQLRAELPATGLPDDQWSVLTEPLPEGARVVLTANASLLDGQRIDPRPVGEATGRDPS